MTATSETAWLRRAVARHRKSAVRCVAFGVVVVTMKMLFSLLDAHDLLHAATPAPVVALGAITGLTYGLLAAGLVLIYRTNRIINFAHGQIGAFAASLFGLAAVRWHVPYWPAFVLALIVAGLAGAGAEAGVVRRLRAAPRLMSVVATLGVGQFLAVFAVLINSHASAGAVFPQPSWLPAFDVGPLRVTPAYSGMLVLSPLIVLAIALFLKRSRFGLAMRAAADNPDAARMAGISASRMSALAWAIAGVLSGFTAILTAPTQAFTGADSFGPQLMLRALTVAVIARMQSLPLALAGGVCLGVVEQLLLWNYPQGGLVEVTLFAVTLVVLLIQAPRRGREERTGSWASVAGLPPLARSARDMRGVRHLGPGCGIAALLVLAALPLVISNELAVTFTGILAFAIVGLSIGVVTGLSGQLTLGQFAVAATGAVGSYGVVSRTGNFLEGMIAAGLTGAVVSIVIGLPALRIRGLMLTVTTLGFAIALPSWLLQQPWLLGTGVTPGQPIFFGRALDTGHSYYYFALAVFAAALALVRNVRRSGFARKLVAVRDNEDAARAFTVSATRAKLQGYLLSGFIAGVGGAVYGHSLSTISADTFPATLSITVVVMTVLGGVSVIAGPILGAIYLLGLPLLHIGNIGLAATDFGALALILWKPGGLIQFIVPLRDRIVGVIANRAKGPELPGEGGGHSTATAPRVEWARLRVGERDVPAGPMLEAHGLRKRFGGVVAVDGVSFTVRAGETVGLIGPNGAGKTTTFELLGGFTRPDAGQVLFRGRDVTSISPEGRARLGLIRSFQDAALFPTLTVADCLLLALERVAPTRFLPSVIGLRPGDREKQRRAADLIGLMGLGKYRDSQIRELSTGTRRLAEIACLVALEPSCLLLDEPSSGVAQRETEALGLLLADLKRQLGITLVVIEHDIPLIMSISDRIVAMADGCVLAEGLPDVVRNDARVIDAYLGGRIEAIERSDHPVAVAARHIASDQFDGRPV